MVEASAILVELVHDLGVLDKVVVEAHSKELLSADLVVVLLEVRERFFEVPDFVKEIKVEKVDALLLQ
jgi:broad-specificity NMP kinase